MTPHIPLPATPKKEWKRPAIEILAVSRAEHGHGHGSDSVWRHKSG
jgi:hypothetical protein